jgi:hypothetical protein
VARPLPYLKFSEVSATIRTRDHPSERQQRERESRQATLALALAPTSISITDVNESNIDGRRGKTENGSHGDREVTKRFIFRVQ